MIYSKKFEDMLVIKTKNKAIYDFGNQYGVQIEENGVTGSVNATLVFKKHILNTNEEFEIEYEVVPKLPILQRIKNEEELDAAIEAYRSSVEIIVNKYNNADS